MTEFEENNPKRLKAFMVRLNEIIDEFHPNIYLLDGVNDGVNIIIDAVKEKLK